MKMKRKMKYYFIRLFRLKGSPHKVAAGFTMGLVPSWFPTFGFGPVLSVGLARLIRSNEPAALVGGILGTPVWPLLFLLNYKVGSLLLDRHTRIDELEDVVYSNALQHTFQGFNNIHSKGYLFLIGAVVNILISSVIIYFIVYFLFKRYRISILNKFR
ncbi:MAG TPA: DUF2062 domain-containing protein [Ureibacillus sp.]|nr:DUF2062 domain-containing protein [Ureibacillus sp.]